VWMSGTGAGPAARQGSRSRAGFMSGLRETCAPAYRSDRSFSRIPARWRTAGLTIAGRERPSRGFDMPRLTLRTLLAYIDDTLAPSQARALGAKVAESESARELIERIKRVTRRRGLKTPVPAGGEDDVADPNTVAEYLSDTLESDQVAKLEETCLKSDVHLAEVAAVHQILTLVLTEPVRVPPRANQRMYKLVEPPASQ